MAPAAEFQGAMALGCRQIIIGSLEILKAIERSDWKRPLGRFIFHYPRCTR
ncbi:hypothetical protein SAMN05444171_2369 [Bradyrhizobium lablabi]|uniref:Uncharacterized protein n=2 Tax=Bradyrhizobium TaxID=374 RepID=A0ABY0PZ30_9BRAD|nr:hypothetical protein SAMN05444163_4794 [Bradyrhizobium ottawaense]SEC83444.1 hypothetical protein SAMN05444171_2369 [Bradyrhizobium lablabi]SHK93556.1 hypothetical protein SAMN05444321_1194 [Bradyrhizobium lablabi]